MKKIKLVSIALAALVGLSAAAAEAADIGVTVNGDAVYFDQPPVALDGRTLVPIRAVFEAMGCQVSYEAASQQVTIDKGGEQVVCWLGNDRYEKRVGGAVAASGQFDVVPQAINGRTLVPVRALSEAFGCDVEWDGDSNSVIINDADTVKIGVISAADHPALDQASIGFADALKDSGLKVYIEEKCGYGNGSVCASIAQNFKDDGKDLVFALGTAAVTAANYSGQPVLFGAVSQPVEAGLVASEAAPGGNVSGVKDVADPAGEIETLKNMVPGLKAVTVICDGDMQLDRLAEAVSNAAKAAGLESDIVAASADGAAQVRACAGEGRAIYFAGATEEMIAAANAAKIPTMAFNESLVERGALVSATVNYYNLGYRAGRMAVRYLKGEVASLGAMPVESLSADELTVSVNPNTAALLGISIEF